MTTETLTYNMGAGQTVRAPRGRLFYVLSAAGPLRFTVTGRSGSPVKLVDVGAGLKYGPVDQGQEWQYLEMYSATAQLVVLIVSDDPIEFAGAVSVVGSVAVSVAPSATFSVAADVALAAAGTHAVASNGARRRITIGNLSTNAGSVRVAGTGQAAAARGLELQPGMTLEIQTVAGVDIYNSSGATAALLIAEET